MRSRITANKQRDEEGEVIITGFEAEISASDMLIITKALRKLMHDGDTHPNDKTRIGQMLQSVTNAIGREEQGREKDTDAI